MNRSGSLSDIINTHLPDRKKSGIFCYRKYLRILRRVGLFIFRVSDFDFATDRCSTMVMLYDIIIKGVMVRYGIASQNKADRKCLIL